MFIEAYLSLKGFRNLDPGERKIPAYIEAEKLRKFFSDRNAATGVSGGSAAVAACVYFIAETAKSSYADPFYHYKFLLEKLPALLKKF